MNPALLLTSPVFVLLVKWTGLLALAWGAHALLRRRHARWRLILWRSLLCCGLLLPLLQFIELPGIRIPIPGAAFVGSGDAVAPAPVAASVASHAAGPATATPVGNSGINPNAVGPQPVATQGDQVAWGEILLAVWVMGCASGAIRLIWLQLSLWRLRRATRAPAPELEALAEQVQATLHVRRRVAIRISDTVSSPFVCGLFRPMILLPRALAQTLAPTEASALLNHELAHVARGDLAWCVAWQWMRVVCWFHPLVWRAPAAHNLACEQEADRVASGQMADPASYAQLLARLALRVLALPAVETRLTANGSSQIATRLNWLRQNGLGTWSWRHSAAAFGIAGLLFLVAAGCRTTTSTPPSTRDIRFKTVLVTVQDEDGKPVADAAIQPTGFRVKGLHGADAYGWNKKLFGPAEKAVTGTNGQARVRYPVNSIPDEKEFTRALIFSVSHPDFASVFVQSYDVEAPEQPVRLQHGVHLRLETFFGANRQPVTDVATPILTEGMKAEDWRKNEDGWWQCNKLAPGGHLLQLMGRLASGEIVYSDPQPFTAAKHGLVLYVDLKPGIRLEGRLDGNVPRPIKNGRVMISVRPPQAYPALSVVEDYYAADEKYGGRHFWHSYRPIAEDGTFVFESLPPGEADIFVLGDGFTTKTGGKLQNRVKGEVVKGPVMPLPQAVPLTAPRTQVEVATEPTATLEFTATTKSGQPVPGVSVGMYPSVFRMWGPAAWQKDSSESPYRALPALSDLDFRGTTGGDGQVVIQNLPAELTSFEVDSPKYQVPIQQPNGWRDRYVRATFVPGETNRMTMKLEAKGADFLGTAR
jgi:beta-lactamase regulating signal transducer with metallopeptidase domain